MFGSFVEGYDMMREQIKLSIDRERQGEIARKELIQGLSHDIKTPLAVINATCEVLELKYSRKLKEAGEEEAAECSDVLEKIRTISTKADSVSSLMSDVMHASLEDLEKIDVTVSEESSLLLEDRIKSLSSFGNIIMENFILPMVSHMLHMITARKELFRCITIMNGKSTKIIYRRRQDILMLTSHHWILTQKMIIMYSLVEEPDYMSLEMENS